MAFDNVNRNWVGQTIGLLIFSMSRGGGRLFFALTLRISLNSPAFLALHQSHPLETKVQKNNCVDFSNHQQWNHDSGWKNVLNNLRLIVQPLLLFWLIYERVSGGIITPEISHPWLDIFPNSNLLLGFNHLIIAMNQFKPFYSSG